MRECIAGFYKNNYAKNLLTLLLFLLLAFFIGLLLRPLLMNLNHLFDKRLAETDLMLGETATDELSRPQLTLMMKTMMQDEDGRADFIRRANRFEKRYPKLIRTGFILILVIPLIFLLLMFSLESKIIYLTLWIISLIVLAVYLICVEYIHDKTSRQLSYIHLSEEEFFQKSKEEKTNEKYMDHLHKRYPENKNKCHCSDRRSWRHSGSLPLCMVQHCGKLGSLWEYRNLKVAVASVDEGYIGNLIPLQLNLGDQVLSALRENTQLNWVFTTKSKAMKGVKSGEYYAAIVIPEDFSTNLMSVFSSDIKKPEITYYSNAKENAIAPKVTDKGAIAVQTQVNEVFIETISDTVLTALQTVANTADSRDSDELAGTLITNLNKIGSDLSASSTTLHSFSQMTDSAQQLLDTTAGFLKVTKEQASANADTLSGTQQSFSGILETLDGATDGINTALTSTKSFYEQMSQTIDQAFQSQSQDASSVASTLDLLSDRVNAIVQSYQGIRDSIAQIADAHPELSDLTAPILAKLDDSIAVQGELRDKLTNAASSLRDTAGSVTTSKKTSWMI